VAGHSKWANIKHRKERQDKRKGKIWSKCSRAIIAAARAGGPDPATNLTLRYAIDDARYENMPKDTIERAIEKGAGAAGGADFETVSYEGYGPAGVAILVDALTDNRTRTVGEVRTIFNKRGATIGNPGSVAYLFESKGQILVKAQGVDEDRIMEVALEAGAEDVQSSESDNGDAGFWIVTTGPTEYLDVKEAIEGAGMEIEQSELTKIPTTSVELSEGDSEKLEGLVEALEDNDDVQKVYTNAEVAG